MIIEEYRNWIEDQLDEKIVSVCREQYGDQSTVYRIYTEKDVYFFKLGTKLHREASHLNWLQGRISAPRVIGFIENEIQDGILMSEVKGKNLAVFSTRWPQKKVVNKLVEALHAFHAVDVSDCPFGAKKQGKVLVHGDACLPNFIFQGDRLSGYIDLGDMAVDFPELDLAAAVWSLQYNLGPGYGKEFLAQYGIKDVTDELVEKLRLQYEDMQREWGLI